MVALGDAFGIGDALIWAVALLLLNPKRTRTAGLSLRSTWPMWGRYTVVAASTASWLFAAILAVTPPATDAEKAIAIQRVIAGFIVFVAALVFAAVCESKREKSSRQEDTEWHERLHAGTREEIAAEVRSTLLESDGARQRATLGAIHTKATGAFDEHSTTHVKVESFMLARRMDQFLEADDVQKYTDQERVEEYRDLFGEAVQKQRAELARLGLSDGQLDIFAYRQEGAESIRLTARALERLAEQLPEDEGYLKGEGDTYSSAVERYESWIRKSMEGLRDFAQDFLKRPARKAPPREVTERAQRILDAAEAFVKSRRESSANPRRLKDILEKTAPHFVDSAQLKHLEAVREAAAAFDSETVELYIAKYRGSIVALDSESEAYRQPGEDATYFAQIIKTPERIDDVMQAIWLLRVRLNTKGYPDDD